MASHERKITKPVAIILLAHYVADIHQPLHVGAEYFDAQGRVTDPDKDKSALGDEGGNTFTLELSGEPPRRRGMHKKKFHGFWDYDAVNAFSKCAGLLAERGISGADRSIEETAGSRDGDARTAKLANAFKYFRR